MKPKLAINGFGRIGRVALKDKEFMQLIDIVAINDTTDAKTLLTRKKSYISCLLILT